MVSLIVLILVLVVIAVIAAIIVEASAVLISLGWWVFVVIDLIFVGIYLIAKKKNKK